MEIKDLTGLGAPATKAIEVISAAIGTLYRPRAIRNEGAAEAERIRLLKAAEAAGAEQAKDIAMQAQVDRLVGLTGDAELVRRAAQRLVLQQVQSQSNLEAIADIALSALPAEVSAEPVSHDWSTRFFRQAGDISSGDLQQIWGKVLASEVAMPGGVSVRTLDVLHHLSAAEARLFERFARHCFIDPAGFATSEDYTEDLTYFGFSRANLTLLQDAGLVGSEGLYYPARQDASMLLRVRGGVFTLSPQSANLEKRVRVQPLTYAGRELRSALGFETDLIYAQKLLMRLEQIGLSGIVLGQIDGLAEAYAAARGTQVDPAAAPERT